MNAVADLPRDTADLDAAPAAAARDSRTTTRRSPIARSSSACSGRRCGRSWQSFAASGAPGAPRGCCSKCWATSGSSSAIRICRTTSSTTRRGSVFSSKRCGIGCARSRSGDASATSDAGRDSKVAELVEAASAAVVRFAASFAKTAALAQAHAPRAFSATRTRTTSPSTALSRVSHVTDATDWRVEYPFVVLFPDTEEEMRGLVARLHRARAHDHSARRRHRLHRRRNSARRMLRRDQHREARTPHASRAGRAARTHATHADDRRGRGCGHETRDGSR